MSQVARDYLHSSEIDKLFSAVKLSPRHGLRNHLMILLAYRHALRISEVTNLRVSDINLDEGRIYCRRLKGSVTNTHPMDGDEIRLCRRWFKERPKTAIDFVFVSERGSPLTRQSAWRIVAEAGERAKLDLDIHPHMLKHSCGYYLANKGLDTRLIQDYMGHKQIQNTVRYTATNAKRFEGLWG
jgi:site-specific recombinase XerD